MSGLPPDALWAANEPTLVASTHATVDDPAGGDSPLDGPTVDDPTVAGRIVVVRRRPWLRRIVRSGQAIVVMGAAQYDGRPSPQLAARLDHVVGLWGQGVAPVVVVTGGKRAGDRFTEAEASARYLTARGVPAAAILEENQAHNSYDSLLGVRDLLAARGLSSVLLVTDPYHSLRVRLVSQELGMTAYVSPTRTSPVRGGRAVHKEMKEAAGISSVVTSALVTRKTLISLGRIIGFRRLLAITG